MSDFKDVDFVIFDVETTGLSPLSGDRIVEIAALKIRDLKPITQFYSLIDPGRSVSPAAFEVNGITPRMLKGAPKACDVLPYFLQYIRDTVVVGYNVKFDISFLTHELASFGEKIGQEAVVLDVLKMARGLLPGLGSYPLWYVSQSLGIEQAQEHRAMSDVEITWEVFRRLLETAERHDIGTLKDLVYLFGVQKGRYQQDHKEKISIITKTIHSEGKLSLGYFSPKNASTTFRKVTPRRMIKERGNDFLIGFCHLRNEERSFRVDRILHLEKL